MSDSPNIYLNSMGHYHPPTILDNAFFDSLDIGSSAEWIRQATGIAERRSVLSQEKIRLLREHRVTAEKLRADQEIPSAGEICRFAWGMLSERLDTPPVPDLILAGTSVPDFDIPANACSIAEKIGLQATAFDVNSACSSFVVDLHVARQMLRSRAAKQAAIFTPERYTTRVDYTDRKSCVLWGDAATAALLSSSQGRGLELIDTYVESNPLKYALVQIPEGGVFWQNGAAVQKFAVTKTVAATETILERNNLTTRDIAYFIGHQANLRMLQSCAEMLHLKPEQHLYNVDRFGNQGAAGASAVLSMHWEKFRPKDQIVISVVGAGLTWASALLRCV